MSTATNALNISSAGLVNFDGTSSFSGVTLTQYATLVGAASNSITSVGPGTSGQFYRSNGAGADASYQTVSNTVSNAANLTDNAVIRGDGGSRGVQTSTVSISDSGQMTNASQPAFLAYLGSTDANAIGGSSGAGPGVTIGSLTALTEVFDQNSDFNTDGTFTAPVTGRYLFSSSVTMSNCGAQTGFNQRLTTSNRGERGNQGKLSNWKDGSSVTTSVLHSAADMDAADTAVITIEATASTKTVGIAGSASAITFFSGYLVC